VRGENTVGAAFHGRLPDGRSVARCSSLSQGGFSRACICSSPKRLSF
jgi:hypothetical protein